MFVNLGPLGFPPANVWLLFGGCELMLCGDAFRFMLIGWNGFVIGGPLGVGLCDVCRSCCCKLFVVSGDCCLGCGENGRCGELLLLNCCDRGV